MSMMFLLLTIAMLKLCDQTSNLQSQKLTNQLGGDNKLLTL